MLTRLSDVKPIAALPVARGSPVWVMDGSVRRRDAPQKAFEGPGA